MKRKRFKRVLLIALIVLLAVVSLGYGLGWFNGLIHRYVEARVEEVITPSATPAEASPGTELDITTSATVDPGMETKDPTPTPSLSPVPTNSNIETPPSTPSAKSPASSDDSSIVSIVQSPKQSAAEITGEEIDQMVRNAVELAGGLNTLIKDGQTVVIKPNLVQMHIDSTGDPFEQELNGVTTDWRVTRAVVRLVRELNPHGRIYVMEGSAGDKTPKAMEHLHYTHDYIPGVDAFIAMETDSGGWQAFDSPGLVKVSLPDGLLHQEYYLNRKYFEADVLISVPCLKTSSGVSATGGIKNVSIGATPANIYGIGPNNLSRTKMVSHKMLDGDLDKWIYDYYRCRPVDFVVIDGLVGFQNGPVPISVKNAQSDKMNMRLIMAGRDAVAVDTVEALVMGWDPMAIPYLGYLDKAGLGNLNTADILVAGKKVSEVRTFFANKLPKLGGVKINDLTGPEAEITDYQTSPGQLSLHCKLEAETVKMEILLDGLQTSFVTQNSGSVLIDVSKLAPGEHTLSLIAYDRFLNQTEKALSFIK